MGESMFSQRDRKRDKLKDMSREEKDKKNKSTMKSYHKRMENPEKRRELNLKLKKYKEEIREIWVERGLCNRCGKEREIKKFKSCEKCRLYGRTYFQKKKKR